MNKAATFRYAGMGGGPGRFRTQVVHRTNRLSVGDVGRAYDLPDTISGSPDLSSIISPLVTTPISTFRRHLNRRRWWIPVNWVSLDISSFGLGRPLDSEVGASLLGVTAPVARIGLKRRFGSDLARSANECSRIVANESGAVQHRCPTRAAVRVLEFGGDHAQVAWPF
jgi:hypothetical protein